MVGDANTTAAKETAMHPVARWGLLLVTALMGVALVGTALAGFVGARRASHALAQANGAMVVRAVRKELVASNGEFDQALPQVLEELEDEGLRYVGILDARGRPVAQAGQMTQPWTGESIPLGEDGPSVVRLEGGTRFRMIAPLRGQGRGRMAHGWMRPHGPGAWLVMEYEPDAARAMRSQALRLLIINVGAALLLLLAAAYFWRQSQRAEALAAQLATDRHLKALGQMSAVLGHELRNPLTSLKGHAQLLLEKLGTDHPQRRGVEIVVREALRMETLTNQVLDFARTGALQRSPVDVAEMVRTAVERASADPVDLVVQSGLPLWNLGRARLEQVLVNLLGNARQASPGGEPIRVSVDVSDEHLVLTVADRGPGLPPGEEQRVFEPFYTTRVKGTGLGLALAKRIVEGHGGRITAGNGAEGGAVFRVELPPGS